MLCERMLSQVSSWRFVMTLKNNSLQKTGRAVYDQQNTPVNFPFFSLKSRGSETPLERSALK